jgi:hypothetical protein
MPNRLDEPSRMAVTADVARPVLLAELAFASKTERVWSGVGPLQWGGHTWTGTGMLGKISSIEETTELKAAGAVFELSGIPGDLLTEISAEPIQGRSAKVWMTFFNEDWTDCTAPVLLFAGRMDTVEAVDGEDKATVAITVENRLRDLDRTRRRTYTDADQQAEYPGDRFFEFVPQLQEADIVWGDKVA